VPAGAGVVHGLGLSQAGEPGIGQDGLEGAGVLGVLLAPDQAVGFQPAYGAPAGRGGLQALVGVC
jgi:hypothetical protein